MRYAKIIRRKTGAHGYRQVSRELVQIERVVAMLAPEVINEGIISARFGHVMLAVGEHDTFKAGAEDHLLAAVDRATLDILIYNRHFIMADSG